MPFVLLILIDGRRLVNQNILEVMGDYCHNMRININ